jgi:hypothetical protein
MRRKSKKITKKIKKMKKHIGGNENIELILSNNKEEGCGFFSTFNKLITYCVDYPNITKIKYNITSFAKGHPMSFIKEGEELFSKIFDEYDEKKPVNRTINALKYENERITTVNAVNFYGENRIKLQPFNDAYKKYVKIKQNIQDKINTKLKLLKENVEQTVGIFIRSNALQHEQPNHKMPRREDYDNALKQIDLTKNTRYFFCIDNEDDLNYFKTKYTPNYYTDIRRTDNIHNSEPHKKTMGTLKDLEDSFIEVALLSECDTLLHCVSNMTTASLYMNMNQKSVFVENKEIQSGGKKLKKRITYKNKKKNFGGGDNQDNLTFLVYTHSDYDDVLELFLKQYEKYFSYYPITIGTNNKKLIEEKYLQKYKFIKNIYEYNDSLFYFEKIAYLLNNIETKYVLLNHESFIIVDKIKKEIIKELINNMELYNIDNLHLSSSAFHVDELPTNNSNKFIHKFNKDGQVMTIFPTIWKRDKLLELVLKFPKTTYQLSENPEIQDYVRKFNTYYISSPTNIKTSNLQYAFSLIPILDFTSNGKYKRNESIINNILIENNIGSSIRS